MAGIRFRRPSPSMAVSVTALVIALGGTSYAVVKPSPRSVGTKELKRNAVATKNIKPSAVTAAKVKGDSLSGRDINEATLGQVPLAARALSVDVAARAAGLDRVYYRVSTVSVGAAILNPADLANPTSTLGVATARCDAGQLVVGGGVSVDFENMSVIDGYPDGAAAWTAHANNDDTGGPHPMTAYAICIPASTPG
jgi:hypothetical protein